jgi:hypothetical protein
MHNEVRFHLSRGKNYMHWQVKVVDKGRKVDVYYIDPSQWQVEMIGCHLVNRTNKAKKVHKAGVKDVSGWIKCDRVEYILADNGSPVDDLEKLYYNPIRDPYWRRESDSNEFVWDGSEYSTLVTKNKQVYILEERV